ncbi:MAG: hypothetical protein LBE48_00620 [Methanomassiliicoccaceae archaeon]|jgi:hypothetical protein|nr:hypothetical protein [Methanomassiliicoccaceae archaeon]
MKKIAIMLALTLIATSAFCMLAPNASAAHVKETYINAQLPDIYRLEVPVKPDTYLSFSIYPADYSNYPRYPYNCFYYNDETAFIDAFRDAAKGGPSSIPSSNSYAYGDVIYLYVIAYDAPHKLKVTSNYAEYTHVLSAGDLWEESDSVGGFQMYSGQNVKVTLYSDTDLYFRTGGYNSDPKLKAWETTTFTVRETGSLNVYSGNSSAFAFATFTIEYDEPPSAGAFGFVFLIVAVACIGLMVYFARPQKIK